MGAAKKIHVSLQLDAVGLLMATAFCWRHSGVNFDIFTIRPDGSDLRQLTTSPANDAHALWTDDGKHIMWNSGIDGWWKEEAALYDRTFEPYGQIFMMKADESEKRQLTDSLWEDSMPRFVPSTGRVTERRKN
jgi:Tol biopolymer transport system component